MARDKAEQCNSLSIFWLKKHGYLNPECSYQSGGIKWTYGLGGSESSIGFSVVKEDWGTKWEKTYLKLNYTQTDRRSGEKEDMDYRVNLATTPCNLGGKRYWFICPLTKNNIPCNRRVGVLFSIGKWFGCRHCGEIAYQSQFESGAYRLGSVTEPDVEKAYDEVKREYYNGKPTRKYMRYLRLRDKMNINWAKIGLKLGMKP